METIGIIAEYNPFHNGHLYHLNTIKEMYPESTIVLVMNGNFTERGDVSIINKWKKTKIALDLGLKFKNNKDRRNRIPSALFFYYSACTGSPFSSNSSTVTLPSSL